MVLTKLLFQVVPETCCKLDMGSQARNVALFTPEDPTCIKTPTTSNSYMNKVKGHLFYPSSLRDIIYANPVIRVIPVLG